MDSPADPKGEWNTEIVVFNGDAYFSGLVQDCARAKATIDLETYIFDIDPVTETIETALIEAAQRGIKVRLVVDGVGASAWSQRRAHLLAHQGVEIRVYHPVYKIKTAALWLWKKGLRRSTVDERKRFFWRINRRTHRKLTIIDSESAWVGSMNISGCHSAGYAGTAAWRDTAVRVSGSGLGDLKLAFDYAWNRGHELSGKRRFKGTLLVRMANQLYRQTHAVSPLVRLNYTRKLRRQASKEFLQRLRSAKTRVWITTPYLAPTAAVVRALLKASDNGADVRVLVPRTSDVFFMPWVARAFYRPLLRARIRIFEYLPSFLHAKSAIIDDWAIVGTSNMNRRSWLHDLEVDVVISKPESKTYLQEAFVTDLNASEEIHNGARGVRGLMGRIVSLLLKDLI